MNLRIQSFALASTVAFMLSTPALALSSPFLETFEDGIHSFTLGQTLSREIGGGVADNTWTVVNGSSSKVLRSHTFLHTLTDDSYSVAYASEFFSSSNVPGGNFRFSTDIDITTLMPGKVNDPTVEDHSYTVALGVLGSGAFSPTSFAGFKDETDGQHFYIAVLTLTLAGDAVDPWASDTEGVLHLFEHNGDGQIDSESSKSIKLGSSFNFAIEGTYDHGTLTLKAEIDGGSIQATGNDTTPLTGTYFGVRTAAFSRSGVSAAADTTFDVDFDNVQMEMDYQPDAAIAKNSSNKYKGQGIINTSAKSQRAKLKVNAGSTANATIQIKNSGTQTDSIKVTGSNSVSGFTVSYFDGNTDITNQVVGGGYTLSNLASGATKNLKLRVKTSGSASGTKQFKISATSTGNANARDTVKAKITIQ